VSSILVCNYRQNVFKLERLLSISVSPIIVLLCKDSLFKINNPKQYILNSFKLSFLSVFLYLILHSTFFLSCIPLLGELRGRASIRLMWKCDAIGLKKTVVPPEYLYQVRHIQGSPFPIEVQPSQITSATATYPAGTGLLSGTVR
jgi:hypothetical protein